MKNKLTLIFIVIGIICFIFWIDALLESDHKKPFDVAHDFAYGLLIKNKKIMEECSGNKKLNQQIDLFLKDDNENVYNQIIKGAYQEGNKSNLFNEMEREYFLIPRHIYDDLELISFDKLAWSDGHWNTDSIICTYAYSKESYGNSNDYHIFCYTVALQPQNSFNLWGRFRKLMYEIPVIGNKFGYPKIGTKWIVAGFYTKDDYVKFSIEQIKKIDKFDNLTDKEKEEYNKIVAKLESIDLSRLIKTFESTYLEEQNEDVKIMLEERQKAIKWIPVK